MNDKELEILASQLYKAYSGEPDMYGEILYNDLPVSKKDAWIRTAKFVDVLINKPDTLPEYPTHK